MGANWARLARSLIWVAEQEGRKLARICVLSLVVVCSSFSEGLHSVQGGTSSLICLTGCHHGHLSGTSEPIEAYRAPTQASWQARLRCWLSRSLSSRQGGLFRVPQSLHFNYYVSFILYLSPSLSGLPIHN